MVENGGPGVSVLGDSISTLRSVAQPGWRVHYEGEVHVPGVERVEDTWWGRVIGRLGGHLVSNAAYSGSVVEGFGFPAGDSDRRVRALVGPDGELPDMVLVYMGINDYGWAGGRNQVMGGSLSASARPEDLGAPYEVGLVADEGALERFESAYARMLRRVRDLAPESEVWCLTLCAGATDGDPSLSCFKYAIRGIELERYNEAIVRAAAASGARVADVAAFGARYDAVDACHPSALGMRQIADMVIACMEGAPEPASVERAPRAVRTCGRPGCAGCELADPSPERWSIACAGPVTG